MKIVIDIPRKIYERIRAEGGHGSFNMWYDNNYIVTKAVYNGKKLPKHHGRLIDADELKTLSYEVLIDTDNPNRADGLSACNGLVEDDIDLAPTIIEGSESE